MENDEEIIPIPECITVAQLKELVNKLPEKDIEGNDFHVHMAEGTSHRYTLLPGEFVLEKTNRKTADGSFGVELTICAV